MKQEGQSEGQISRPEYRASHYVPGIHHQAWCPVDWWYPNPAGKKGSGGGIIFEIDSVTTAPSNSPYNGLKVATVTVICAPCDQEELIDTSVQVVDWMECLFNEEDSDLVDRKGAAFEGIGKSRESGATRGTNTLPLDSGRTLLPA